MGLPRFSYSKEKKEAYAHYEQYGYAIFTDLTDQLKLTAVKKSLNQVISMQAEKHVTARITREHHGFDRGLLELAEHSDDLRKRLYEVVQDLPCLADFAINPNYSNIIRDMGIKIPVLLTSQVRMDLPGDERFLIPPHQEIRGIRSPNLMFFITALEDISAKNGALKAFPGSHKSGPLTPQVDDDVAYQFIPEEIYREKYPETQIPLKAGETIALNMYLIHGSSPNLSDKIRWSLIVRFEDAANMPYLDNDRSLDKFNLKG